MKMRLLRLAALGLLLLSLPALSATSPRGPKREEMLLNDRVVVVDYQTTATAEDLGLPFYPGAKVESSFSYTVATRDGKPVLYFAQADLTSADAPDRVAQYYSQQMPDHPQPEALGEGSGRRLVLAVGNADEVRTVTIVAAGAGCRIQLVRSTEPVIPEAGPRSPQPQPQPPMPRGPRGGGRRGLRRGMRA